MTAKIHLASLLSLLVGTMVAGAFAQKVPASEETGISVSQLRALVSEIPPLPKGSIQAVQFLRRNGFGVNRVALLTEARNGGWQIFVFHLENAGRYSLEWKSGKLDDSFSVSDPNAMKVFSYGQEQGIKFEGCAAHACPDVFSILLYVPSKRTAFTAKYVRGETAYSLELDSPENSYYKTILNQLVREHGNQ